MFSPPHKADTLTVQVWNTRGTSVSGQSATMKDSILRAFDQGWEVWIAGHSMGGSNAHTSAALLALGPSGRRHRKRLSNLSVMTFNAPMVLVEADANRYELAREEHGIEHRRIEK